MTAIFLTTTNQFFFFLTKNKFDFFFKLIKLVNNSKNSKLIFNIIIRSIQKLKSSILEVTPAWQGKNVVKCLPHASIFISDKRIHSHSILHIIPDTSKVVSADLIVQLIVFKCIKMLFMLQVGLFVVQGLWSFVSRLLFYEIFFAYGCLETRLNMRQICVSSLF